MDELGRIIRKAVNRGAIKAGADPIALQHGWMIGYLHHQTLEGEPVFQKEMEKKFHMPKSTLADTLSYFEKEGLIERIPVENDARCKQIVLTEKGENLSKTVENQINQVEDYMRQGISDEEIDMFFEIISRMKSNALAYEADVEDITKGGFECDKKNS